MRILVTGASRGIGAAIALKIARDAKAKDQSLRIAVAGNRPSSALEVMVERLTALGVCTISLTGDLHDVRVPERLVAQACEFCGGLDGLVANAGITAPSSLAELNLQDWDRLFAVNVRANWLLARAAYPALVESRGAMVAVASASGMAPHPGHGAYSATKAALIMLCRQLAQEWAPLGIRVNSVSPGMIRTTLTEAIYQNPEVAAMRNAIVPLGRVGEPDDVASMVSFLLGSEASFIIGQNICMDGGYTDSSLGRIPGLPHST
jgi:NAD(P)-dependent dehydrogenase (short-subunit alcohol dehydrogenase family)